MTYDDQTAMYFPSFTFCPEYYLYGSKGGPEAYNSKVLEKCNVTGQDLDRALLEKSKIQDCFESALPKLEDFDIQTIDIWKGDATEHRLNVRDHRLNRKEWIYPGFGRCFTLTLSKDLTKVGILSLVFKTGSGHFYLFLHSLGKFIGWPPSSTGVSRWNVGHGQRLTLQMENLHYIDYQDPLIDGICNNDPGYLQDECFAKSVNAELGCRLPYGSYQGSFCQDVESANQAKAKFWSTVTDESKCKIPCKFIISSVSTQSNTKSEDENSTFIFFNFKRQLRRSRSRILYKGLELMAEVGGYLGLFLGLSIYHVGDQLFETIKKLC